MSKYGILCNDIYNVQIAYTKNAYDNEYYLHIALA